LTVFTTEYLAKTEVLEEFWADDKYPDAERLRNARARELRKQGWSVKCQKWDFTDLARCCTYSLEAARKRG